MSQVKNMATKNSVLFVSQKGTIKKFNIHSESKLAELQTFFKKKLDYNELDNSYSVSI